MKINAGSGRGSKVINIVSAKPYIHGDTTNEQQGKELAHLLWTGVAGGVMDSFFKEYHKLAERRSDRRVPDSPPRINDPIERAS